MRIFAPIDSCPSPPSLTIHAGAVKPKSDTHAPILLVEENEADLYLTQRLIESGGVKNPIVSVREAGDAILLLEAAISDPILHPIPSVMFTDLKLFRSSGLELIKWVRQQRALDRMKVVVLTGSADPKNQQRAKELGADQYLIKLPESEVFASIITNAPYSSAAALLGIDELSAKSVVSATGRILVIEDDDLLRDMLKRLLTHAGYDVTVAADGHEGLRTFRAEPPDLVITDLVMPGQEGISTIIKLHDEFPATPIIAISGANARSPHYLDLALKLGATRSLAKPFTHGAMLVVVHELLAKIAA